jgi:predicted SAM-dependent methyltransferase
MKKLNMWCGKDIREWYLNRDITKLPGVDTVYDFEQFPYPFPNNAFDEIYCSHILEHMIDLGKVMEEFIRIGKPWCKIKVRVPYFASSGARSDYTHKRAFTRHSFDYFHPDNEFWYYNSAKIKLVKYKIHFLVNPPFLKSTSINIIPDFFINLFNAYIYERFFAYRFPSAEIHFLLEVDK